MLKQAFALWKRERTKRSSLRQRLILFFIFISVFLILSFTLLLTLVGITGSEEHAVESYIDNELTRISHAVSEDFGRISVEGIQLAEEIIDISEDFFREEHISAGSIDEHHELIEPLLEKQMQTMVSHAENLSCGGVFIMLDTAVSRKENARSGIFIKKTQPTSTRAVGVKLHYLRGPADIARDNKIELLGQWKMEYDIAGQDFFTQIMDVAKANTDLSLSRLFFWTGRVTLKDNSEAGFLLCVPLKSEDGCVFGICGIEVSDRMFKSLYSPEAGVYENVFAIATPSDESGLLTSRGIIAGNYYLTRNRLTEDLTSADSKDVFERHVSPAGNYAGKSISIRLYPNGSPYKTENWSVAVLMPETLLESAVKGSSSYFIWIVVALLVISLAASILISRRYLKPVTEAFDSIRSYSYAEQSVAYLEISDLFEFLAQKDREYEEEIQRIDKEKQEAKANFDRVQTWIARLGSERMPEIDNDSFELFLQCLHTLTPKERSIFDMYLEGKSAKEIMAIANINQNTLKYHNKNIYSKLGVSSRKQLLEFAALMKYGQG